MCGQEMPQSHEELACVVSIVPAQRGPNVIPQHIPDRLGLFMVTHDLESLRTVCDRIAALADGKVIAIGTMTDMRRSQHPWMQAYFQGKRGHMLERVPSMTGA
jgi:ABC-type sugar transport system ATPase subunit